MQTEPSYPEIADWTSRGFVYILADATSACKTELDKIGACGQPGMQTEPLQVDALTLAPSREEKRFLDRFQAVPKG
jgi:hypothetical protein